VRHAQLSGQLRGRILLGVRRFAVHHDRETGRALIEDLQSFSLRRHAHTQRQGQDAEVIGWQHANQIRYRGP